MKISQNQSFGITADYVESFLYKSFPNPSQKLEEIYDFGKENGIPIIGPTVGRFLHLLVIITKPRSILEIGTAIGYSTIWLASALSHSGTLTTIEIEQEAIKIARENVKKAGLSKKVNLLFGDAAKIIPSLNKKFDFIFLDTAKSLYPQILPDLIKMLRVNGLLVADNTLYGGLVATTDRSRNTVAIREFDKMIINDKRLYTIIIPIRDGVSLSLKLKD
jgi:predicted O-methyltransferase YrrM